MPETEAERNARLAEKKRRLAGPTLADLATSRAKGTDQAGAVAKICKVLQTAIDSKPGGKRGRVNRAATIGQCEQALRQFVYGGVPAAGAAGTFGIDLSKVEL